MATTCQATRRDGRPCTIAVLVDGKHCFGHSPETADKRAEARRRGGQNRSNARRLHKLMPGRLSPVFDLLEQALTETYEGGLDHKQATAMAALGRALATILQVGEFEQRLQALEAQQPADGGRWGT